MTRRFAILMLALTLPGLALAQAAATPSERQAAGLQVIEASDVSLEDFQWISRLVVIFADTPADPRFTQQMQMLTSRPFDLIERDVVVIVDTDPSARSEPRQTLRPRGFQVTLIGKDGEVELRKPSPWSSRELARSIDKMPLRQDELREGRAGAG